MKSERKVFQSPIEESMKISVRSISYTTSACSLVNPRQVCHAIVKCDTIALRKSSNEPCG